MKLRSALFLITAVILAIADFYLDHLAIQILFFVAVFASIIDMMISLVNAPVQLPEDFENEDL